MSPQPIVTQQITKAADPGYYKVALKLTSLSLSSRNLLPTLNKHFIERLTSIYTASGIKSNFLNNFSNKLTTK